MDKLKVEKISKEEINTVKAYINGSLLRKFDSVFSLTNIYEKNRLHGLNFSYYSSLISKMNTIDSKTINAIAVKYFDKKQLKTVISGNLK
ncbi:MAG TPA: insulinase family protein [Bacteroidetes bacterium]|nr:insulinase family protein [Bacteroidota bacterium]